MNRFHIIKVYILGKYSRKMEKIFLEPIVKGQLIGISC